MADSRVLTLALVFPAALIGPSASHTRESSSAAPDDQERNYSHSGGKIASLFPPDSFARSGCPKWLRSSDKRFSGSPGGGRFEPIDVVENHPHGSAVPNLALAAHLTDRLLQPLFEESSLNVLSRIRRVLDKDFVQ